MPTPGPVVMRQKWRDLLFLHWAVDPEALRRLLPTGLDLDLFEGATIGEARAAIGWPLQLADRIDTIAPPSAHELDTLRALHARTREAHARPVRIPLQNG